MKISDQTCKNFYAYEYLCHLEEAKLWMESVLKESLPPTIHLEENLRNGVYLAKIGNFIAPEKVPLSRIYDIFQHKYKNVGLQFRHTDNINYWIEALKSINFPKIFIVETTDVYDKKNMPKVIYCIHALSSYLFSLGQAPLIQQLFGKIQFTERDIDFIASEYHHTNMSMPAFQKIGYLLAESFKKNAKIINSEIINLNRAIDEGSEKKLIENLELPSLSLTQVVSDYVSQYLVSFKVAKDQKLQAIQNKSFNKSYEPDIFDEMLNLSEIQGYIREVNINCLWQDLSSLIKREDKEALSQKIALSFIEVKDYNKQNIEFYVKEALSLDVNALSSKKARDIIQNIVKKGNRNVKEHIRILDAVNKVKQAVLTKSKESLLNALRAPCLKLSSFVLDFAATLYLEEMQEDLKMSKELTYKDIKSIIFVLNEIAKITMAIDGRDYKTFWALLSNSDIPFMNIDPALKTHYFKALSTCRLEKLKRNEKNCLLTFVDIQECIDMANIQDSQQTKALVLLEDINKFIKIGNSNKLLCAIQNLTSEKVCDNDAPLCIYLLKKSLRMKQQNSNEELWLNDIFSVVEEMKDLKKKALNVCETLHKTNVNNCFSENVLKSIENKENKHRHAGIVSNGKRFNKNHTCLSEDWLSYKLTGEITIQINPSKKIFKWLPPTEFLNEKNIGEISEGIPTENIALVECTIIKFQAVIRGFIVRRKVRQLLKAVITIQKWWRKLHRNKSSLKQRKKDHTIHWDSEYYNQHVSKIIKLQAFWRGYLCRRNFCLKKKIFSTCANPSFQFLRRISISSTIPSYDYSTDLKVQSMKKEIVEAIKINQELARTLEKMDMKIGLLVQNRMSIEAILAEKKKLQNSNICANESRGIKAFSKEAKRLLTGYQQLFYLLQTDPVYLTRLIVRLPSKLNHIIQNCVLTIFNYGSNSRDAYLLLRLFRLALYQEVQYKFQKPIDAITGNPLVLKLAVAFARQGRNPLKNILGFLIEKVLNDKIIIDTNPVDIYHRWINQIEMESGKPLNLPQTVTIEEALLYPEVVDRLNHNLRILKSWVGCFLDRLVQCVNQFPYALRFIAKQLKNSLFQKFPSTPEKDILKIVGNLVYYQYINSAIVAPDAFYTVSLPPDRPIKVEQRRNLASIAKILHFAATKKGFGEESQYLTCLNPFIIECHKIMKDFCRNCCNVEDLEEHYNVTKYSELLMINKPRIYISLEEIRECHKLLLEVQQEISPDPMDPIHEILDELGPTPSLATLIGSNDSSETTFHRAGRTQICLELDNKFQSPPEDVTEGEKLFIKTKELITKKLRDLHGETLSDAVRNPKHVDIATDLAKLELIGLVKSEDDYQDIIKSLITDIFRKQDYINHQNQEINTLKITLQRLYEKKKFYENQVSRYEQYLKTCLSNMTVLDKKKKQKKELNVKYSGTRLREKGILISLEGVPAGQLKNVQFEISTTKLNGVYSVHGCFMGIEVEKIDLDIQELLKLQFEGFREMDLFGKARINVNLLLHLLNKKFHARTK